MSDIIEDQAFISRIRALKEEVEAQKDLKLVLYQQWDVKKYVWRLAIRESNASGSTYQTVETVTDAQAELLMQRSIVYNLWKD